MLSFFPIGGDQLLFALNFCDNRLSKSFLSWELVAPGLKKSLRCSCLMNFSSSAAALPRSSSLWFGQKLSPFSSTEMCALQRGMEDKLTTKTETYISLLFELLLLFARLARTFKMFTTSLFDI